MEANTVLKARHLSYKTELDINNNLRIQNTQNKLFDLAPTSPNFRINRITDSKIEATAEVLNKIFGLARLKELNERGERLSMIYRLSPQGKILEVQFVVQDVDTLLTVEELEILEQQLIADITYDILWENEKNQIETNFAFTTAALPFNLIVAILDEEAKVGRKVINVKLTPPPLPDHLKNL